MAKPKSTIAEILAVIGLCIGGVVLAVGGFFGFLGLVLLLASIPAFAIAFLWMFVGPFLATATGIVAFGTITFWQTFAVVWILSIVVGILARLFSRR